MIDAREFSSFGEARTAAYEELEGTPGAIIVSGTQYEQGGRSMISTALSMRHIISMALADSAKKDQDPDSKRNRPINPDHVKTIKNYLLDEQNYILPPVVLNVQTDAIVTPVMFSTKAKKKMAQVFLLLPLGVKFYIADGQHRIEAVRLAIEEREDLGDDAMNVNIVLTESIDQVHQDFVDCAKTKPISLSLLGVYDTRNPLSQLVKFVTNNVELFKGRIDKISPKSVGKNSHELFTLNQIQFSIVEFMLATAAAQDARTRSQIANMISTESENKRYKELIVWFYQEFTERNPIWNEIAQKPKGEVNTPKLRREYLHLTATGLRIISRIGHEISLQNYEERNEIVQRLAELDWKVNSEMWRGNVVSEDGRIDTNPAHLKPTIVLISQKIGLAKIPDQLDISENSLVEASAEVGD